MYVIYIIDNVVTNPYLVWKLAGSPQSPSSKLFQQMRQFEVRYYYYNMKIVHIHWYNNKKGKKRKI